MADVTLIQGSVVRMFNKVPDTWTIGCSCCVADKDFELCADLPNGCGYERVHFVEVL